jgi:hypothetical protein
MGLQRLKRPASFKAVARGYAWRHQLLNGSAQSINEIALREGITRRYVARLLRLGFLAPTSLRPYSLTGSRRT